MSDIIPFGKHAGKSVEEIRAVDPQYLDWIVQQSWLREKNPTIYQTIINMAPEATETPEHNALQALFLDDAYCIAVGALSGWGIASIHPVLWDEGLVDKYVAVLKARAGKARREGHDLWVKQHAELRGKRRDPNDYGVKKRREFRLDTMEARWVERNLTAVTLAQAVTVNLSAAFEPIDALMTFAITMKQKGNRIAAYRYTSRFQDGSIHDQTPIADALGLEVPSFGPHFKGQTTQRQRLGRFRIGVEIKPSVGDDYPAVLRQMQKHNFSGHWVLLIDQFAAKGVTRAQMVEIFRRSGISVVWKADVDRLADAVRSRMDLPTAIGDADVIVI